MRSFRVAPFRRLCGTSGLLIVSAVLSFVGLETRCALADTKTYELTVQDRKSVV